MAMQKNTRKIMLLIVFGVALYAALMNFSSVTAFVGDVLSFSVPIVSGLIVAFILSVPMQGFENLILKLCRKSKNPPRRGLLIAVSFILTLICLALVLVLVCTVTIPELKSSVLSVANIVQTRWPEWMAVLDSYNINTDMIKEWFAKLNLENLQQELDLESLVQTLTGSAGVFIGSVVDVSVSIVSGLATAGISAVIAIYVLLGRHDLARQSKKFLYAYCSEKFASRLCYIGKITRDTFSKFLSGQCIEAIILGVLIFLAYTVFGLPYAGLIGILTGFFAFIPYVGAFAACFIGAILIFIVDPTKALIGIVVYIVVQFIENQFIYPNVVGTSVGLSALWTLVAALIGGNLFGLLGMIFFIPIVAVIYQLVRENIHSRLEKKLADGADDSESDGSLAAMMQAERDAAAAHAASKKAAKAPKARRAKKAKAKSSAAAAQPAPEVSAAPETVPDETAAKGE